MFYRLSPLGARVLIMGRLQNILLAKIASFANPLQKTATPCRRCKRIHWVAGADARNMDFPVSNKRFGQEMN